MSFHTIICAGAHAISKRATAIAAMEASGRYDLSLCYLGEMLLDCDTLKRQIQSRLDEIKAKLPATTETA